MSRLRGLGVLVRHALRVDRTANILWISLLSLTAVATARRYGEMFSTDATRESFAHAMESNSALQAFGGQLFSHSLGSLVLFKAGSSMYNLTALMALLAVIRHTRAEEEQGRLELVASGAVGRLAPLVAALLSTWAVCLAIGALTAVGLIAAGLPTKGSTLFGLAIASLGCVAASFSALFAQVTPSASRARGLAGATLGASFVLRFVADGARIPAMRWLSPEGWCHEVRAFADDRVAPLALSFGVALVLGALATRLASTRELGAGWLGEPSPSESPNALSGSLSLAMRLQRGSLWAWSLGLGATGALLGSMARTLPELAERSGPTTREFLRRYGASSTIPLADTFLWLVVLTLGYTVALYPVLAVLRLRSEEQSGRAELLLSTSVSRVRWALSHALFAVIGPLVALALAGVAMGIAYGTGGAHSMSTQVPRVLGAAMLQAPAVWTLGGVAMLAFGAAPRWSVGLGWAAFVLVNMVGEVLGPALGVDYWLANRVVPFHHLPRVLTGEPFAWLPVLALCAVTAASGGLGLALWRRRDLAS